MKTFNTSNVYCPTANNYIYNCVDLIVLAVEMAALQVFKDRCIQENTTTSNDVRRKYQRFIGDEGGSTINE
jgi:hypothetical protein